MIKKFFLGEDLWQQIIISIDKQRQLIIDLFIKKENSRSYWKEALSSSQNDISEQLHEYINHELLIEDIFLSSILKDSGEIIDRSINEDEDNDDDDDDDDLDFWKYNHKDYLLTNYGNIENLPIFQQAFRFSNEFIQWLRECNNEHTILPSNYLDYILAILTHIVSGYQFGFDPEFLTANIVHNKISLDKCNSILLTFGEAIDNHPEKKTSFSNLLQSTLRTP